MYAYIIDMPARTGTGAHVRSIGLRKKTPCQNTRKKTPEPLAALLGVLTLLHAIVEPFVVAF